LFFLYIKAKLGDDARLEKFDDAGHALFIDDADRFNQLLEKFVEGLRLAPGRTSRTLGSELNNLAGLGASWCAPAPQIPVPVAQNALRSLLAGRFEIVTRGK
jgi:hypothetical protein